MPALLRPRRWLAALLIAASPAMAGQVLPLVHPCAAEATDHAGQSGHGGGHHAPAPDDGADCTCIGSCQGATLAVPPEAIVLLTPVVRPLTSVPPATAPDTAPDPLRPIDRLPLPTAPPTA